MPNHRREPTKVLRVPVSLIPDITKMIQKRRRVTHADPKWYYKNVAKKDKDKTNKVH